MAQFADNPLKWRAGGTGETAESTVLQGGWFGYIR